MIKNRYILNFIAEYFIQVIWVQKIQETRERAKNLADSIFYRQVIRKIIILKFIIY